MSLLDPALEKTLAKDVAYLKKTAVPIVTVSASYKEDLKGMHGMKEDDSIPDVVFSRAHYSMALGLAVSAWDGSMDPDKAWIVDPTNYVSNQDWKNIQLTEAIGKTIARHPVLKKVKDVIDHFGRSKLPILPSITPPLLHLFQHVDTPILSLHIAAGNILAAQGKTVIQVVTDPHVREEYLEHIELPNMTLCVFDQKTKTDALEKAALMDKEMRDDAIVVTGPPIDPRIIAHRHHRHPWRSGSLNICLTTGGLGTNKGEIADIVRQLAPELQKENSKYNLMVYAATQRDIADLVTGLAERAGLPVHTISDPDQEITSHKKDALILLYHPQIVDANELLIKHAFGWADGFITKPSGDMAYDAAVSGSFLLTLKEWGVWEQHISELFEQHGIARRAQTNAIVKQLQALTDTKHRSQSWVEKAMHQAIRLPETFTQGNKHILDLVEKKRDEA